MELRQLRYFKAVVNAGSFSEAAHQLGRTQQAVSKSISLLEEKLGAPILERGSRAVTPTLIGKLLLQHADTIERQVQSFSEQLDLIRHSAEGKVRIGAGPGAAQSLLPQVAAFLFENHPKVSLEVFAGIMPHMLPEVLTGELDLIVSIETEAVRHPEIDKEVLCHDDFCIVVSKDHPIHDNNPALFEPKRLLDFPWIVGRNLGNLIPEVSSTLSLDGITIPANITYTNSIEFSVYALKSIPAITILPKRLIQLYLDIGQLVTVAETRYCWQRPLLLVYSKKLEKSPAVLSAIDCLRRLTR